MPMASLMLVSHLYGVDPETSSLGPQVESVEDDNGLCDNFLRQPEQDAGSLGQLGAGEAKRALEVGGYAVELGAGGRELVDCSQWI